MSQVSEFVRESHRIDQQIWDALAIKSGESVLWCGLPAERAWVQRIVEIGASLTIIEGDNDRVRDAEAEGFTVQRGSTTMIGARPGTYDIAVAFHYLHEIDPSFHAPVVAELARVGRRIAVVEPAPPADHLGRRIAQLYALAKREQGAFENYQPVDYWRKLLAITKGDVVLETLTFRRVPPKHAVEETVRMILRAMAAEDLPEHYLTELEAMARRPDAQLLPLSRYVIIGANVGEMPSAGAGTKFRPNESLDDPPVPATPAAPPRAAAQPRREYTPAQIPAEVPPFEPPATVGTRTPAAAVPASIDDPFGDLAEPAPAPSLLPAVFRRKKRQPAAQPNVDEAPTAPEEPPFGAPFAVPVDLDPFAEPSGPAGNLPRYGDMDDFGVPGAGGHEPFGAAAGDAASAPASGWQWEPPESAVDFEDIAPEPERPAKN